jgi:hypothetical protein
MATSAHVLIDGRADFNVMESYYGMFPFEMSTKPWYTYNLNYVHRLKQMTFESLLDKMIAELTARPSQDNFVVVTHGLYDPGTDFGKGLSVPLCAGSTMKAAHEILEPLLDHLNGKTSDKDMADWEKNYTYTNKSQGLYNAHYPKGSVARLVGKMRDLRRLKVRCVELRACNLGTNPAGMSILGRCLSTRFMVAPDRKMFFVSVSPVVNTDAQFDANLKFALKDARVFTNPMNSAERLAIQVKPGAGVSRLVTVATTAKDLRWFTDKYIWKNGKYAGGGPKPARFYMEGIDLAGTQRYALPQEAEWNSRMVEVGPLPGNQI